MLAVFPRLSQGGCSFCLPFGSIAPTARSSRDAVTGSGRAGLWRCRYPRCSACRSFGADVLLAVCEAEVERGAAGSHRRTPPACGDTGRCSAQLQACGVHCVTTRSVRAFPGAAPLWGCAVRICPFLPHAWRWELSSVTAAVRQSRGPGSVCAESCGSAGWAVCSASPAVCVSGERSRAVRAGMMEHTGKWCARCAECEPLLGQQCVEGSFEAKLGFSPNFPRCLSFAGFLNARRL